MPNTKNTPNAFKIGDWVISIAEWGKADGIADELSINTPYLVYGIKENRFLNLLNFSEPVNPIYLRIATPKEIYIEIYKKLNNSNKSKSML